MRRKYNISFFLMFCVLLFLPIHLFAQNEKKDTEIQTYINQEFDRSNLEEFKRSKQFSQSQIIQIGEKYIPDINTPYRATNNTFNGMRGYEAVEIGRAHV